VKLHGGHNMNEQRLKDSRSGPSYSGIPTFMRCPFVSDPNQLDVVFVGVPFDGAISYRSGTRFGPRDIRVQSMGIRNYNPVLQINPFEKLHVADYGDIDVNPFSIEDTFKRIKQKVHQIIVAESLPFAIGGDHSISLPILRALACKHGQLGMIHFDAHSDTSDDYFGEKYYHGTPFRRAIEENLLDPHKVIQIGIRGQVTNKMRLEFAKENGITIIRIEEVYEQGLSYVSKKIQEINDGGKFYLSFDIDAIDPAYAPGTGTPQIGGLTSFQALQLIRALKGINFVGCDLVEVSPPYDSVGITSLLAANLMYEMLCVLAV